MKKLTIEQARRELAALLNQRLAAQQDRLLNTRLTEYMDAIEAAISDLQQQLDQLSPSKKT